MNLMKKIIVGLLLFVLVATPLKASALVFEPDCDTVSEPACVTEESDSQPPIESEVELLTQVRVNGVYIDSGDVPNAPQSFLGQKIFWRVIVRYTNVDFDISRPSPIVTVNLPSNLQLQNVTTVSGVFDDATRTWQLSTPTQADAEEYLELETEVIAPGDQNLVYVHALLTSFWVANLESIEDVNCCDLNLDNNSDTSYVSIGEKQAGAGAVLGANTSTPTVLAASAIANTPTLASTGITNQTVIIISGAMIIGISLLLTTKPKPKVR